MEKRKFLKDILFIIFNSDVEIQRTKQNDKGNMTSKTVHQICWKYAVKMMQY